MKTFGEVKMFESPLIIPTYEVYPPDKNPLFLEKRVYQGSSGKVYPLPVTEKISDDKVDKSYHAITLENDYLKVIILPELGGRIQRALDKTNNYDFVYYNHVIKPALVGLAGPWISGGIEFNWPQHHRPSTFSPVDYTLISNEDGSKTVWVSEIDKMYGTKGMAGFTLYPNKAYIQITGQVFNRTDMPQTFLWWANPAVPVNDHTFSVFPPDVHAVMDHGKRAVSSFPIATGEYYKFDYSEGIDISRYKNISVPTSYMAYHSDFDFVGNYDESSNSGLLHVADHHINAGKKQWTWGNSDFGQAWDRNLTDEDGPYIELMTGVFTDNQPDFTWLKPYEEKSFTQYFMPYKGVGSVKNATINALVNLELGDNKACITVYTTSTFEDACILLYLNNKIIFEHRETLTPMQSLKLTTALSESSLIGMHLVVQDSKGTILVEYTPTKKELQPIPAPADPLLAPSQLHSTEELYLAATHLEQYRHATFEPSDYYLEGLKRDPSDMRLNNGYGLLQYRRGNFKEAHELFCQSVKKNEWKNPNPYYGEAYFNLGLSLLKLNQPDKAYDAFFKATWSGETQSAAFYQLACLDFKKKSYTACLESINKSISKNQSNMKSRHLKAALLRILAKDNLAFLNESLALDPLDTGLLYELSQTTHNLSSWKETMRDSLNNYLELSLDYIQMGLYDDALIILSNCLISSPLIAYYTAYIYTLLGDIQKVITYCEQGELASPDYCFPNKLSEIIILENVITLYPKASFAHYYLGNLLYDKKQYEKAISHWETSLARGSSFSIVPRNLSLAYFNKRNDSAKALKMIEKAFKLQPSDARLLLELDQLTAKLGYSNEVRLERLEKFMSITIQRDDLYVEYITLLNNTGQFEKAFACIMNRKFHAWEGGEGKISRQYVYNLIERAKLLLSTTKPTQAIELLAQSLSYPLNLGEGKLPNTQDNITHYYLGAAYDMLGNSQEAQKYYQLASIGMQHPESMMYYNDQPADTILYQGFAHDKLGNLSKAKSCYHRLISYGEQHLFDEVTYDYFAVSLPDTMIYEDNISLRNEIYCHYLIALGHLGLGNHVLAKKHFTKVLELSPSHQGAIRHIGLL
ncbi:MAG: DUF5107 domain-containing protein [Cellulosilyticaceae bacterium]